MEFCLPWYLDEVGTSYSDVWNIISGLCWLLNSICAWTCLDSTDRQITGNLRPCSSIFYLFHPSSDLKAMGGGRNYCVVCSCSQLHTLSQTVFLVMETFLLMCHNSRCKTSPMLCSAANKPHWGSSQTEQKLQDRLLLDSSYRSCVLSSQQLFFYGRKAYLWTIIWHHVHIPPTRCSLVICRVCSPPCYVTQWVAFFLFSPPPLHQHTNI